MRNSTVTKVIRAVSRCSKCMHEWPYRDGDENRECPACNGGEGKFWRTGAIHGG